MGRDEGNVVREKTPCSLLWLWGEGSWGDVAPHFVARSHNCQGDTWSPCFASESLTGIKSWEYTTWVVLIAVTWCWLHCTMCELSLPILVSCFCFNTSIAFEHRWRIWPLVLFHMLFYFLVRHSSSSVESKKLAQLCCCCHLGVNQ